MIPIEELSDNFIYKSACVRFGPAAAEKSALAVIQVYDRLGLPLPVLGETGPGTEGWLVFLNDFGLLLRIETVKRFESRESFDRINDDPDILQPILTFPAGHFVAELCPGVGPGKAEDVSILCRKLSARGIKFWDARLPNIGRIPVRTQQFPDGKPVVIDRLGVRYMSHPNLSIHGWLSWLSMAHRSRDVQAAFYAPLRQAFQKAVSSKNPPDLDAAWALARQLKSEGRLLSSWDKLKAGSTRKCLPECGRNYAQHLKAVGFSA